MFCSNCGKELPAQAQKCEKCGQAVQVEQPGGKALHTASRGIRFLNYLIDIIGVSILGFIVSIILGDLSTAMGEAPFGIIIMVGYYLFFETIFQKTPGKFLTKTKVVLADGNKASWQTILGRSVARLIPFEAFSMVSPKHPVGWHDSLSKTLVVPDAYTAEDVKKIIPEKGRSVVIITVIILGAIVVIGALATLAIVALGNARAISRDAKRIADIGQITSALELYYGDAGEYPAAITGGQPLAFEEDVYLPEVPTNPTPTNDGDCPIETDYHYTVTPDKKSYQLTYCLGGDMEDHSAGEHQAVPERTAN